MQHVTQEEGHLMVAAIRILSHRNSCPPAIEDVAELLNWQPEIARIKAVALHDVGVLRLVDNAYDHHLEVDDHHGLDALTPDAKTTAMDEALAEFDHKKHEEQEKMANLFEDDDHKRRHQERMDEMDGGLFDFQKDKPKNPFGDS
jgi:hypothetical protein